MALLKAVFIFCCGLLNYAVSQQFTPGCSFFNGKCVYNVQLGAQQRCGGNSLPRRGIDGSCTCDDVTKVSKELNSLQTLVDRLQKSMTDFKNQLTNVSSQSSVQTQQSPTNQKYLNLLSTLRTKNDLLNRTDEEVANVLKTASNEIENLREKLKNTTSELATCQISQGITHKTQTGQTPDYTTFYCNFQNIDICKFLQDRDDDTDWTRQTHTGSSTTGPKVDHTYGTTHGYYMVLRGVDTPKSGLATVKARITSPVFQSAPNYCIRFWYNMYGKDVDTLNVYAKVHGGRGNPIYSVHGNQGHYWNLAEINLGPEYTKSVFQITFEASHHAYKTHRYSGGRYYYDYHNQDADIAIDDLYVYNTTCNSLPAYPTNSYQRRGGNETSFYNFHTKPTSWYNAQDECRKENAHSTLAVVKSASEQKFLENLINSEVELTVAGQNGFYLNGNDMDSEGQFKWTSSGYPESLTYSNFHQGQPNNVGNNQDCLLMEYPTFNYEWGDVACTEQHPFICEITIH